MSRARFVVGIDLGTTNTAVAYVDTRQAAPKVQSFELPQLVAPGALDRRRQLPSFVFLAGPHDLTAVETALPWAPAVDDAATRPVVGELARTQGARQPGRMIASSKSWLCHGGVDRHAAILPWGVEDGPKRSPIDAAALVLTHVKAAWDHLHRAPGDSLGEQEIIITVPASFDEAARELTIAAAARAGLPPVVLLEEPQAAFYAWMSRNPARRRLRGGDRVLVFDVGGGTTDFTLIAVGNDRASFNRTAVGDHLLLGGDNIDLTLAKIVEGRLHSEDPGRALGGPGRLDSMQWHGLVHACRLAKETLLSHPETESLPITVSGRSSRLIGSTLRADLSRSELDRVLDEGFFPAVDRQDRPRRTRGGLHEFGLPYASDPAITRHLAGFFGRHGITAVDAVLFNGGAMTPAALRTRILEQIGRWQPDLGAPRELPTAAPELAVAEGAAVYGLVRRGQGVRIGGGTPRSFFVGVGRAHAICLAPKGIEEGSAAKLERDFRLVTNRPVSFKLYSSSTRNEPAGTLLALAETGTSAIGVGASAATVTRAGGGDDDSADLVELPPIVAALRAPGRNEVTVKLEVRVTELSALEIWCTEQAPQPGHPALSWRLVFDMRAGGAATAVPGAPRLTPVAGTTIFASDATLGRTEIDLLPSADAAKTSAPGRPTDSTGSASRESTARSQAATVAPGIATDGGGGATRGVLPSDTGAARGVSAGDGGANRNTDTNRGGGANGEDVVDRQAALVSPRLPEARVLLEAVFAAPADDQLARVMKSLEERLGRPRDQWNPATARALHDVLFAIEEQRKRSPAHEARWLHLAGFTLRPGTGAPLDDWRAKQMWRIFNEDLVHPRAEQSRLAWWITWRRIAGGLSKGQQHQIYLRLAQLFLPGSKGQKKWDEVKPSPEEAAEMLRCLANLERLSPEAKLTLGDELSRRMESKKTREDGITLWALARIGARIPLYGPLNCVIPASKAAAWLQAVLAQDWSQPAKVAFSIAQIARRTGDRARDLDDATRAQVIDWLRRSNADRAAILVAEVVALEAKEEHIALGDTLPPGLHLPELTEH